MRSQYSSPIPGLSDLSIEKYCAYTQLWRNVIWQALRDASDAPMLGNRKRLAKRNKWEAREWLTGDSQDFIDACDFAGIHHGTVRRTALRAIAGHTIEPRAGRVMPLKVIK